ncbi:metallophosphoesterase family protein [Butyrivibrio sp. MC2013]|uniref:metallophosphoesterase family protein n=1 Tax=Butyrivibrio sp. MC2013 TaxID=1280686 RepID=UPI0003FEEFCA|nr:metallophosphoesterase [Butyrivibrio sp. MC2013]
MVKALVISDSHGRNDGMREVIKREKPFDVLIHSGDVDEALENILGPTDFQIRSVRGNCDYISLPYELIFKLGGRNVLLLHGHTMGGRSIHPGIDMNSLVYYARSKGCDMLIYGHTHIPDYTVLEDGFIIINPGSITLPRQSDRQKTYGVLEVDDQKVSYELRTVAF